MALDVHKLQYIYLANQIHTETSFQRPKWLGNVIKAWKVVHPQTFLELEWVWIRLRVRE